MKTVQVEARLSPQGTAKYTKIKKKDMLSQRETGFHIMCRKAWSNSQVWDFG